MKLCSLVKKIKKIFFIIIVFALFLTGCGSNKDKNFTKQEDFNDAKIGVLTGSSFDLLVTEYFPNAEKAYQNSITDLVISLKQNKIDGILMDSVFFTSLMWEQLGLSYVNMDMPETEYGIAFPKNSDSEELRNQANEFINKQKENGWLDAQKDKWFSDSEPDSDIDFSQLTGENGVLRVATTVESKPFNYLKNDKYYGYNAEFIYKFAYEYGYSLEIDMMDFGALLPSLSSGKYDIAISSITVTEERKESVNFSDIYCSSSVVMAVHNEEETKIDSLADLENGTIGIVTGSNWDSIAQEKFPNAQRKYFNSVADAILALKQGSIDAFFTDKIYYAGMKWENESITFIDEPLEKIYNSLVLSKNNYDKLLHNQLNEFIGKKRTDGTLKRLEEKWFGDEEPSDHPDYTKLNDINGTLKVAIGDSMKPTCYQRGTLYTGYEVDFLTLFAEEYGYKLDFQGMSFDALIPSVMSGKCDIGACGITVTPERLENVIFTDANCETDGVAIIYQEVADETNFWEDLKEDFEKTFIRESRWKLIVSGMGVTMLISICSIIGGSLLGFGLYMMSRSNIEIIRKITEGFTKVYSRIIAGTPIIVILMILFYVIFGSVRDMSGILVAILGFTFVFGAFVYDHLHVSVCSVDGGQLEAAYALGYTKNKTFFRIILPQAMKVFLPSYCSQSVEMIKATAVVGYIAVNDLTKIGDIIRSNTLEAFFPLIATAIIYFLLTWILSLLLNLVSKQFEPKRRSDEKVLRGVDVHD